jgi:hypothetical protein
MKSIANIKKLSMVTIAVFISAALIMAIPAIMSIDIYAQRDMRSYTPSVEAKETTPSSPWSCASKLIKDSPEGNALGWNPDGTRTAFTIDEPCYFKADSTVLVNIKDGGINFAACNVDFSTDGFFEVYCTAPPSDGSELRYLVLVDWLDVIGATPTKDLPSDLEERNEQTNATQQ